MNCDEQGDLMGRGGGMSSAYDSIGWRGDLPP